MRKNKTFSKTFGSILTLVFSCSALAVTPEAADILNKNNRSLSSPPSSLKANSPSLDYRYATGVERAKEAVQNAPTPSQSSNSVESVPVESLYRENQSRAAIKDERGLGQFLGERNLGLGLISAGAYGIFGAEVDIAIDQSWTAGLGIGTGMTYRTWGFHTRYLFRPSKFTGFVEGGYSNWYLHKASKTGEAVFPEHMAQRFLTNKNGDYISGARAHLIYPGFGVLYKHSSGMGAIAQIQYFINTSGGLQGALGASAGLYLYF